MTKRNGKVVFAIAVIAASGFACGGNNATGTNNGTNNGATNNGATNNGATNNGATNNGATNNGATNNGATNNGAMNNGVEPEPPGCDDPTPPARCTEDPTTFTYGPASVMNTFIVEGTENEPVCCFDYTDDGEIDNSLGTNLAAFGYLQDINDSVAENLASGSLVLVFEHDGLDAADNDDAFTTNFYIGEHDVADFATAGFQASANPVLLDPASFDMGAQPQAYLPDGSVTGGAVVAGPGSVKVEITLFDSPLTLTISRARIEADVDAANSGIDATGVSLTSGKLGGVVKVEDIFNAVNDFAATSCECLGLEGADLVDVASGSCNDSADGMACETAGNDTCAQVVSACGVFGAVALFADVDLDGDGLEDSVSIGAAFAASGATITGVAP